jgi:hypothetical protein
MHPDPNDPPAPAADPGRSAGRAPLYLSALALLTALLAALVSLVALAKAGDGPVAAAPAAASSASTPTADPVADGTAGPTGEPTVDPTEEPTAEATDGPDPQGDYTVAYQQEKLRIQPSNNRYVDLDEPSANASNATGEFYYSGYVPQTKLSFDGVGLAEIKIPVPTAGDCVQELRRAPIDLEVAPAKGQLLCVLTSAAQATDQGIRQKVVLVRVDSIAADGTLNLTVTAWNVPR